MKEPTLRELDSRAFRKRLGAVLEAYTATMRPPQNQVPGRHTIMERHAGYPRFRALVAEQRRTSLKPSARVVGFAYGFHGATGQWWHDVVQQALAARSGLSHAEAWLTDPFEVAELHVRPEFQGQGLGRRLLTELCGGRTERTVVLSTLDQPDSRARRLYRSVGMTDLIRRFEFPGGGPPYAIMGGRLPLTAPSPVDPGHMDQR